MPSLTNSDDAMSLCRFRSIRPSSRPPSPSARVSGEHLQSENRFSQGLHRPRVASTSPAIPSPSSLSRLLCPPKNSVGRSGDLYHSLSFSAIPIPTPRCRFSSAVSPHPPLLRRFQQQHAHLRCLPRAPLPDAHRPYQDHSRLGSDGMSVDLCHDLRLAALPRSGSRPAQNLRTASDDEAMCSVQARVHVGELVEEIVEEIVLMQ